MNAETYQCERCGECRRGNFKACKNRKYFDGSHSTLEDDITAFVKAYGDALRRADDKPQP